jgi:hypothetical protein
VALAAAAGPGSKADRQLHSLFVTALKVVGGPAASNNPGMEELFDYCSLKHYYYYYYTAVPQQQQVLPGCLRTRGQWLHLLPPLQRAPAAAAAAAAWSQGWCS